MPAKKGSGTGTEVAKISVKVTPNTHKFRSELKEDLNRIEREIKGDIEVIAHLDKAKAKQEFDAFLNGLRAQGRNGVKINTHLVEDGKGLGEGGGKGGKRGGSSSSAEKDISRLNKMFNNLKDKLTTAPSFGSGINLTGMLLVATGVAAVLAPLVGIMTGLLLTLPGLLSLVLTPIGAIMLGLDGIKKAAEVLTQPFEELKATMSAAVQAQFTPVFERLRSIFPSLGATLPAVTQGLSQMADSFVRTITSSKGMASIETTIAQIGAALQGMSPGVGSFTSAMLTLAESFTGGPLQGLVGWFNGAMASFDKWVSKAKESGDLDKIFNRVGEALKYVMDLIGQIAAIGLGTLTDDKKWGAFMGVLKAAGAVLLFFFVLSDQFLAKMAALGDAWAWLKTKVGEVMSTIMTFGANAPAWVQSAWSGMLTGAVAIWETIKQRVSAALEFIKTLFTSIPGVLAGAWSALTGIASAAWEGVKGLVAAAWEGIKAAVSEGVNAVIAFVTALPGQMVSALGDLGGLLLAAGKAIMDGFLAGLKAAWEGVKSFVSGIAGWIKEHKGPISYDKTVLVPNGESLMQGLGKGLESGFAPVLEQAKSMAGQIADAFASGADPTQVLSGFSTKEVTRMEKVLKFQSSDMGRQIKALEWQAKQAGKGPLADSLKARADELKLIRDGVDAQREMLDLTNEYNDANSSGSSGNVFLDAINEFMKLPNGFFGATANQAMQDLGISGNGALQAVAGYGADLIGKGVTNIFNTSNVDDTMALFQNQTNRQSQGIVGR